MSMRRRIENQYRQIARFFAGFSLPSWLTGTGARVTLVALFVILVGCYFYKISAMATVGYQIRDLEKTVADLEIANQKLEVEIARWSAMSSIEKRLADSHMVSVSDIKYIEGAYTSVAKK